MAHINLKNELPGIRSLLAYRPETAQPLNQLAEVLLRSENSLSRGERELIATYVSALNDCFFCQNVHGALARHYLNCDINEIDTIKTNFLASNIVSEKMKALLYIAENVQKGGKNVTAEQVQYALKIGASQLEIHDTVLIAAAFCMFNRYVDGLATFAPSNRQFYIDRASQRAQEGYLNRPLK
jgi:uncharacterized peroxidase-related enzyme